MKKIRILVLTDSLGFPRNSPEKVESQETYSALLKGHFKDYEIIQSSNGGATVEMLYAQAEYLKLYQPDLVILQSGIVDSSPRALTKFELDFIKRVPLLSTLLMKVVRKYRVYLRKKRNITYTNSQVYIDTLEKFKTLFGETKIVALGIIPAGESYEKQVPGIGRNISQFNEYLKSKFNKLFIDNTDILEKNGLMSDNHHLNQIGHKMIFDRLANIIETIFAEKSIPNHNQE